MHTQYIYSTINWIHELAWSSATARGIAAVTIFWIPRNHRIILKWLACRTRKEWDEPWFNNVAAVDCRSRLSDRTEPQLQIQYYQCHDQFSGQFQEGWKRVFVSKLRFIAWLTSIYPHLGPTWAPIKTFKWQVTASVSITGTTVEDNGLCAP